MGTLAFLLRGAVRRFTAASALALAAAGVAAAQERAEAEWQKEVEKYQLAVEGRGRMQTGDPENPTQEAMVTVTLWWDVERFVKELKGVKGARAYLVFYHDENGADAGKVKELVTRARQRLADEYGLKAGQVELIDGGLSRGAGIELWVVPPGALPPVPQPMKEREFGFYAMPG